MPYLALLFAFQILVFSVFSFSAERANSGGGATQEDGQVETDFSTNGEQHSDGPSTPANNPSTRPQPRPPTVGVPAANPACVQNYQAMLSSCRGRVQSAERSCDSQKDSGMASVVDKAAQIATAVGAMTGSNVNAACSKIAGLTQAANAAVAAYRLNCANSVRTCRNTCQEMLDFAESNPTCFAEGYAQVEQEANSTASGCEGFNVKIEEANQAIQNYAQTTASASQCNLDSAAGLKTYCEENPNHISCVGLTNADCSDPQVASTNKICICAANPFSLECSGPQSANVNIKPGGGGSADFSSRLKNSGSDGGGFGTEDIADFPSIQQGTVNKKPAQEVGGRQGSGNPVSGSSGGGSGGGGPGMGGGAGSAADPNGSAVNAGFYGGGGRFGSGGAAAGGPGGGANGSRSYASQIGQPGGPDLRKFLPGGAYDPKRMNGGLLRTTGTDGITGPHTNIWTKIQNRYRVMSPTLLP